MVGVSLLVGDGALTPAAADAVNLLSAQPLAHRRGGAGSAARAEYKRLFIFQHDAGALDERPHASEVGIVSVQDAVTVDDEGLRKWYDANVKKLALPERVKIRYIRFDAKNPEVLARMEVSEEEMHDHYDSTIDKYTSTDTNGVEVVKSFDEVKDEIEKELRVVAAVDYYTTNLQRRVYANLEEGEDPAASRLDRIAREENATVATSDWFAPAGTYVEGFMKRRETIAPGAREFAERVAELDPEVPDLRYGLVSSDSAVWLMEKTEISEAHTPSFEEAKDNIGAQALRDAKADALKAEVEAVAQSGIAAVLATDNVTTNLVFSPVDLRRGEFQDQTAVVRAATKLKKGEISPFVQTGTGRGLLVVCEDRTPGDVAAALNMRDDMRSQLAMMQIRAIGSKWDDANLARMGLEVLPDFGDSSPDEEESAE